MVLMPPGCKNLAKITLDHRLDYSAPPIHCDNSNKENINKGNDKMTKAIATVQIKNERTIITEWRFAVGAETGFHRHQYDYAIVPMTSGTLKLTDAEGDITLAELNAGQSYFKPAGVEHNVENASSHEFVFVEIEFK